MAGIHGLQAENMRGNQSAALREDAIKALALAKDPGMPDHLMRSEILSPLLGGADLNNAKALGDNIHQAAAFKDMGAGMGSMAQAGAVPLAGQAYNAPFGLLGGTTGEPAIASAGAARATAERPSTTDTVIPGVGVVKQSVKTPGGAPTSGAPRPGNVGTVGGQRQETPLPGTPASTTPTATPPPNSTPVEQAKNQAIAQKLIPRIASVRPDEAKDIQAGGNKFTVQGNKIVFTGASGRPYQYDATK